MLRCSPRLPSLLEESLYVALFHHLSLLRKWAEEVHELVTECTSQHCQPASSEEEERREGREPHVLERDHAVDRPIARYLVQRTHA
jgi:hypothetical protein